MTITLSKRRFGAISYCDWCKFQLHFVIVYKGDYTHPTYIVYSEIGKHYDNNTLRALFLWSISLIKSDLKWCIHLSRSLFLYLRDAAQSTCCKANVNKPMPLNRFNFDNTCTMVWHTTRKWLFHLKSNCDFQISFSNRDTSRNAWNRHWGSFMVDTGILSNNMKFPSHKC